MNTPNLTLNKCILQTAAISRVLVILGGNLTIPFIYIKKGSTHLNWLGSWYGACF